MANKLICLVGMCGSGKSATAEYLTKKREFGLVRFGQITMDKIIEMGKQPSEALEKKIREDMRKEHGMAAFAILNIPKIDKLLKEGDVIADGLYSWEEYLVLKEKYKQKLAVVAVYASPQTRYARLQGRAKKHAGDKSLRYRSFTKAEAASRDKAELENLHKGGPIAMADYTVINESSLANLHKQIDEVLKRVF